MFHCPIPISVLLPLVIIHIIHCPHVSLFYTNNSPTVTGHNSHYPLPHVSLSDINISPVTGHNSHYPLPHVSLSDTNISPVTGHNLHYPLSPCVTVLIPISVLLLVTIHIVHCPHVSLSDINISPVSVTGHNSHYPLPHVSLSDTNISPVTGHNLHYPLSPCVTVLIPISVLLLVTIHIVHCPHVSLSDTNTSPTVTCQYSHCPLPHVSLSDTNTSPTVTGHNSHYPLSPCFAV